MGGQAPSRPNRGRAVKDVYGRLAESRLLPRERDVVSGRLSARRDDKRQDRDQPESSPGPRARRRLGRASRSHPSPRTRWAVGGAGLLLVAGIAGAFAIAGGTPETPSALSPTGSSATAGSSTAGGPPAVPAPASPTEPPVTAIRLDYSGGKLVRNTCSDPSGRGKCSPWDVQEATLTVRCTPGAVTSRIRGRGALPPTGRSSSPRSARRSPKASPIPHGSSEQRRGTALRHSCRGSTASGPISSTATTPRRPELAAGTQNR